MKVIRWPSYFEKEAPSYAILFWYRTLFCFAIAGQIFFNQNMLMSLFHSSHCYPIELFQFLNISFSSSQTYALAIGALIASLILAGLGVLGRFSIFGGKLQTTCDMDATLIISAAPPPLCRY